MTDSAMLQAMDQHQESAGENSGFGLGHGDSIATITDGMKWLLGSLPESALISFFLSLFEGLLSGINLGVLFGKSGNMLGIKILEKLAEFFSGGGEGGDGGEGGAPQDDGDEGHDSGNFPHLNDQMGHDFNDFGGGTHHDQDYHPGQSFDHGPLPPASDDHDHGAALGG